jgi:hypothetical protein
VQAAHGGGAGDTELITAIGNIRNASQ